MVKKKILLLSLTLLLIVSLFAISCAAPEPTPAPAPAPAPAPTPTPEPEAEVYEWRMPCIAPRSDHPEYQSLEYFCEIVEEASDGRIITTPYGGDELMPYNETYEAVARGVIEGHFSEGGQWTEQTNGLSAFTGFFPFTIPSAVDGYIVLDLIGAEEAVREAYAEDNLYLVHAFPVDQLQLLTNFPVTGLKSFEGKVIRALGQIAESLTEAGIRSTYIPGGELYGALERGVVDGEIYAALSSQYSRGFHEVTKYTVKPGFGYYCSEIAINLDTWNSLPDDLKAIVDAAVVATGRFNLERASERSAVNQADMIANWGHTVQYLPESDVKTLASSAIKVVDKMSEGNPEFAEMAGKLKDFLRIRGIID